MRETVAVLICVGTPNYMKTIVSLLSAALVLGGLFVATPVQAEDKKPEVNKPAKKKNGFFPFRGLIKSVDAEKGTISLKGAKGKPDRVFAVGKEAKLTLDGKATKLADIKAGMFVGGRAKRAEGQSDTAVTINVRTKKPERKKKPKKDS